MVVEITWRKGTTAKKEEEEAALFFSRHWAMEQKQEHP
jgi:hypothetical protein